MKISTAQKISWIIMRFLNCFFFKFRVVGRGNIGHSASPKKIELLNND